MGGEEIIDGKASPALSPCRPEHFFQTWVSPALAISNLSWSLPFTSVRFLADSCLCYEEQRRSARSEPGLSISNWNKLNIVVVSGVPPGNELFLRGGAVRNVGVFFP